MKDCPSCGTENRDQAIYCRKCRERMSQSIYIKPNESLSVVHIGVLFVSVILLITSFGLLMGGTTLRSIQVLVVDEDGYITSDPATVDLPGYAIVLEDKLKSTGLRTPRRIKTERTDGDCLLTFCAVHNELSCECHCGNKVGLS